jgi:phosphopantothenoylcysteine decarboxylase/phosphopantothenate--cysteine ligase
MARPVLVTAGATRNRVDAIRYLSAHASGRTGVELAMALTGHGGARVHLLGSEEACLRAEVAALREGVEGRAEAPTREAYTTSRDLMARMETWLRAHPDGVLVHSAAVGDYELDGDGAGKIPSGLAEMVLRFRPGPKIVDHVRSWAPGCCLVSFKAAPPGTSPVELEGIARAQLRRTGSDLVFANVLGHTDTDVLLVRATRTDAYPTRGEATAALLDAVTTAATNG